MPEANEIKDLLQQAAKELLEPLKEKAHENGETLAEMVKRDALVADQFKTVTATLDELEGKLADVQKNAVRPGSPAAQEESKTVEAWAPYMKAIGAENTADMRASVQDAFMKYARHGTDVMTMDERKLLSTDDNTNGGYLVIPEFANEVIKELAMVDPIRGVARVRTTGSNNWSIPRRTSRAAGGWVGEADAATESNSVYGRENIPNGALWAYSRATNEELADNAFNLEEQLRMDFVEEFAYREGVAFVSGNGVSKPEGLWTNSSVLSTVTGSATALTYAGLIDVSHGDSTNGDFNPQYTRNGRFLMSNTTLGAVRQLEDTLGQLIWQPNAALGSPPTVLGFPYSIVPDAPAIAGNAYPVTFGDIGAAYTILDRVTFEMLRNPYAEDKNGIVRFTAYKRVGGSVVQPAAIRRLQVST